MVAEWSINYLNQSFSLMLLVDHRSIGFEPVTLDMSNLIRNVLMVMEDLMVLVFQTI